MAVNKPIVFHSDAGHGWLEVPRKLVKALGIEAEISSFSYQKHGTVYLEEDSDAPKFIKAYTRVLGMPPYVTELDSVDHSLIRTYRPFTPRGS